MRPPLLAIVLLCLLAVGLLRHYGPALWVAGKRWIGRRIFGSK